MQLTIVSAVDDRIFSIEVDTEETVETLKAILEAESGVPAAQQHLVAGDAALQPGPLSAAGVADGAMIMLLPSGAAAGGAARGAGAAVRQQGAGGQQQQQRQQQQQQDPAIQLNPDGTAKVPAAFIQAIKGNAEQMAALQATNPSLAKAIRDENVAALQAELKHIRESQLRYREAQRLEDELAVADPFDVEAQRRIEELIRQKAVEENLAAALEHSPEVFGSVEMLYVIMEVNPKANNIPVKTFIDSGAQMTIMTYVFAEKCGLSHLIDKRFQGVAVGVGSSKIIGRIHAAPIKVAGHHISTSITVLEQKDGPQFIFGLDNLKRHQCCIDLARNVLHFGSCSADLPFLPDHEIPRDFKRQIEEVTEEADKRAAAQDGAGGSGGSGPAPMDATGAGAAPAAAAAPPAAAAAPAPAPAAASAPSAADGAGLSQLMELGFPREAAQQALQAAGGNVDMAAAMLFGGM